MAQDWAKKVYNSQAWIDLRKTLIAERGSRCEHCGRVIPDTKDVIADHIVELTPDNVSDPMLSLNQNNVQLLCLDCHNLKHHRFSHNSQSVYIVYGSPCAGKKTYVRHAMFRGDIMLELDVLYSAISGCVLHDKPDNVKQVVFHARDAILDAIATRLGNWTTAYVIGGYPAKGQRESLAKRLGAKLMFIDTNKAECLARADTLGPFASQMKKYVEKWWSAFEP